MRRAPMKCSTCSGEIRKVSMVWAAEQRHGLSGWWFSSSSSVLGERLAPPPPPRIWPTVLAGAIAALAAFVLALHLFWQQGRLSYEQFWWWRLIFFVACGITILGFIRFVVRRDHWNDEYDDWSELWICLACGMVSDHPQDDARPLRAIPRAVSGKLTSKLLMLLVVFFGLET